MPAVTGSAGSYGRLIVTPDMEPPDAGHWDAQEQTYRAGATSWDGIHHQIVTDSARFRDAADSQGFDEVHRVNAVVAEEAKTIAEWHAKVADKCADIATVLRETRSGQEQLVREADAKIASAKLSGEAEALVAQYHGIARYRTEAGVTAAMASHASFRRSTENTRVLDLLTKLGDAPAAPPARPLDSPSPGITQGDDNPKKAPPQEDDSSKSTPLQEGSDQSPPAMSPTDSAGTSTTQPGIKTGTGDEGIKVATEPVQPTPGMASPAAGAAPLSGGGVPTMGGMGGGGMGSGGAPKMPGALGSGGMPGMGSNPLGSGVGQTPDAGIGLPSASGVPGAGSGAGSPAAAFTQGMSTGGAIGGGMPAAPPPAPASPSPALSAGGQATPVSATAGGGVPAAAAHSGMVAPAAAPAWAGMGTVGGAPMMLPPGSMGPPAGPFPPPAATVPAGALAAGSNAPSTAPPAAAAGAGPTLIPASVVAAGQTAAARERRESADAAAAKELVWKLQHASYMAGNYLTGWAVGVLRSPSGTETVITSNDGASYIPAGVFVPRSVRVLATDPLVKDSFRKLWFGWSDPARVLVEYAQQRAEWGWRLVAAASTLPTPALRDAGVEHPPACTRETNPLLQPGVQVPAPVLDDMHVHRLAVLWPEVYPRLLRVMDADPICQDRIVSGVSAALMAAATTQAQAVEIPNALRHIWVARGGDREPSTQQWAKYNEEAQTFNGTTAMSRPAFMTGGAGHPRGSGEELANYRAHWLVARAAEHIGGWANRPLPLPDMCYAAAATGDPDLRDMIVKALVSVEEDLAVGS
ncbi:hypothetical protein [Mycolicibacterium vanbaalenii]|uniref:Methyl-accepting chemotaxis sensory transducer n=1 Tax=Mycolicibacterium vanbaalenii (strain DSM 7251 / JCM 13017 / BCRC 16820 / KCTC 9966 / NRRL B-24157 / PYR-1) TaxID=350058 RepID=A1TBG8_MYCVP|nr:conserved hypothetical protein [Mycolicibacterium vanbaalenii PYR-1]MCV7128760.1 hypothetical protein [Mycolicibacterium vanbaalenii PYR-1]